MSMPWMRMLMHRRRQGKSVEQLRMELKEQERLRRLQKLKEESSKSTGASEPSRASQASPDASSNTSQPTHPLSRKDSSPVKVGAHSKMALERVSLSHPAALKHI